MDNDNINFLIGLFVGAILMFAIWMVGNDITEKEKTLCGYLTYKGIRYTVTEYDRLDVPPKPESK